MQKSKTKSGSVSGKSKAGLLKSVISNAKSQGKEISVENASDFIDSQEERITQSNIEAEGKITNIKEEKQETSIKKELILAPEETIIPVKKIRGKKGELKEVTKAKVSYDLSISNINQIKRLKHWERYSSEGAAIDFILTEYFKRNPQNPI
ncbi:MAG: hypothetical protein SFT68_03530 [Rickettsiaceae bacterium]|nr:hypothetical protein [Rickettsiaceae bacterium]